MKMPANNADNDDRAIASAFVSARRAAAPLAEYPGLLPKSLNAGYAIQDIAIALQAEAVAGWKVGRIWPPAANDFGSNRLAGPIFAPLVIFADPNAPAAMSVFDGGFGAVEAEFIFRLGSIDPAKSNYSLVEAKSCVNAVHYGIEIASSPLAIINDLGPAVTVSDFGNNHGLIVGPEIAGWHEMGFDTWPISVEIDGVPIGKGIAEDFPDGTLGSVRFLLELLAKRGITLPEGSLVSTGAITGVHPIGAGQAATARFGDKHVLYCTITKAAPASE